MSHFVSNGLSGTPYKQPVLPAKIFFSSLSVAHVCTFFLSADISSLPEAKVEIDTNQRLRRHWDFSRLCALDLQMASR